MSICSMVRELCDRTFPRVCAAAHTRGVGQKWPSWISSWEETHPNREGEFIAIAIVFAIVYSLRENTPKRRVSYGRTAHYFGRFALCGAAQHVGGAHRQEV